MTKPLSVQLYSVRDQLAADRDGTIRKLAEIGFTAVEPFEPANDPAGFKALLDGLGMTAPTAHGWGVMGDEPDKVLAGAAAIGSAAIIVPSGIPEEDFTTAAGLDRAADVLNGLAEKAAGYGLTLGYHNHWWEFSEVDGVHALEGLAARLAPEVFLEVDTYWAAVGGAAVPAMLARLGSKVQALHVKDGPVVKGEPNVAVGTGSMAVPAILNAAPDALRVIEFDSCATDVMAGVAASFAYLTGLEPA